VLGVKMKKPESKNFLKKFTIVDILIILCVVGAVAFAFMQIGNDDSRVEAISFDSSTMSKFVEKYSSFYKDGHIVKTHVGGYSSKTGEYQELYGTIVWVNDDKSNVQVLVDIDGTLVLAGLYTDLRDADIYVEHITIETSDEKYKNVTDVLIEPMKVETLENLVNGIPDNVNYTIYTTIAISTKNNTLFQELQNELYSNGKKSSIKTSNVNLRDQITLVMATNSDITIGNKILGSINGQTDLITLRIYNSNHSDIEAIKKTFNVKNIRKVT
jgi:flagellar basal body-associated protein FliL